MKYRILLIEDVKIAQKVACLLLSKVGFIVDTADNGAQAITLFNKEKYDIILVDLGLPDIDGITLVETFRKTDNENQHAYTCALTSHNMDLKSHCIESGMNDFLLKPLTEGNVDKLLELLE